MGRRQERRPAGLLHHRSCLHRRFAEQLRAHGCRDARLHRRARHSRGKPTIGTHPRGNPCASRSGTADASPRILDTADARPHVVDGADACSHILDSSDGRSRVRDERSSVDPSPGTDASDPVACIGRWRVLLPRRVLVLRHSIVQRCWVLVFGVGGALRHLRGDLLLGCDGETSVCAHE